MDDKIVASKQVTEKRCNVCEEIKPLEQFAQSRHGKHGHKAVCCKCCVASAKRYRETLTIEERRKRFSAYQAYGHTQRNNHLKRTYNLTLVDYNAMLEAQGGVCAICKTPEVKTKKNGVSYSLSVDHDHETGEVRGLLCNSCNLIIGYLEKLQTQSLDDCFAYLEKHRTYSELVKRELASEFA